MPIISIAFIVGIIMLQIFLSKQENKLLGLILPIINIIFSIIAALGSAFYENTLITGIIITHNIIVFLTYNISTIILIVIYFVCRKKLKKNKELDKMNIQDLN